MNILKEEQNENNFNQLFVGYDAVEVVKINPTKDELLKLLEVDEEFHDKFKEPEYLTEKDGNPMLKLDFYVKAVSNGKIDKTTFFLENTPAMNAEKTKSWYVNQTGEFQCTDDEEKLFSNFTKYENILNWKSDTGETSKKYVVGYKPGDIEIVAKKVYRQAVKGEQELMKFILSWLVGYNPKNIENIILLDIKKLFKGDVKELSSLISDNGNVVLAYTVSTKDDKSYQRVENRYVCPGSQLKFINSFNMSDLEVLLATYNDQKTRKKMAKWQLFIAETNNPAYPMKNHFIWQPLAKYDENSNPVATNDSVVSTNIDKLPWE